MIWYALTVVRGCIHKPFMEIQMGDRFFRIDCAPLRHFIQTANEKGLYQAFEHVSPKERGMFEMLYDEFKDLI